MTKETMDKKRIRLGIPKQSDACKCGHSNSVHVAGCFVKGCKCKSFEIKR